MTVEREEPELLVAVCDQCGERRILDLDQDAHADDIDAQLHAIGWARRKPEKVRFPTAFDGMQTQVYAQDFCGECQLDEPRVIPKFGAGRKSRGPADNDPCDEWPRSLVFAAVGLRPDCGHPRAAALCAHCEAGIPIGRMRA